jgi:hypothetical protein
MIVFDIRCTTGHRFEGWFSSADDFADQKSKGLLSCPVCGAAQVERVPSATRINTRGAQDASSAEGTQAGPSAPAVPNGMPVNADAQAKALALYMHAVSEVLSKTEDVGKAFPEEARKMHYNEKEARPIRGMATQDEHEALVEEGIPVARLPIPPKDQWN